MKRNAIVVLLSSILLLQGCAATLIAGSAAVVAKATKDPRTIGRQIDDNTLEARVHSAISEDQQLKQEARIVATAYQGAVLLTGQAPSRDLAKRAEQIALAVEGTTTVHNEIRQGMPVSMSTLSADSWITLKIRSQILGNANIKSANVKVITENAEVFLSGMVNENEGKTAAKIASQVSGVRHVTTVFTYVNNIK